MLERTLASLSLSLLLLPVGAAVAEPASVMVLYFDNNTANKDYDKLAKGMADMMITDLSSVPSLQVVEREKLESLLGELKLQQTKYFDPKTAQRIGKGVGAVYAVAGAFVSIDPSIRVDVRVIRIDNATVLKSGTVTGDKSKFFDLWQQLSAQLIEGLSVVLPGAGASKARAAARANNVDSLGTVLEYSDGLDARDHGDLDGASRHLSKVVAASPEWKLGKDRYRQIMKSLYDAKSRRTSLLGTSEQQLVDHVQAALLPTPSSSVASSARGAAERRIAYRVLAGQLHLARVVAGINGGKPPASYRDELRAYVDNQLRLFDETREVREYEMRNSVSAEDERLSRELGISQPGSTFPFGYRPYNVLRELNQLLMRNTPSIHVAHLERAKAECLFKLDPAYPKIVTASYDKALAQIAYADASRAWLAERETMRTLKEYASALAYLGRGEEGIAKLQEGLDRFPKSDEFASVEKLLREILDGKVSNKFYCGGRGF